MKELFCELQRLLLAGEDAVLVSILVSSGSAPRGAGARMLVGGAGRICGSIGGGAVEYRSEQLALEAIRERKSFVKEYHLSRDLGMICGGNATVLYQFIAGDDAYMQELCDAALRLFAAEADIWLITKLVKSIDEINSHRSIHDVRESAKSAIAVEWQMGLAGSDDFSISLGLTAQELQPYLISAPVSFRRNGADYYVDTINSAGRVLIFGGGHVAQALTPVLARLDFNCWVMDNRPELCDEHLFPGVKKVICGEYEDISRYIEIQAADYAVVMTHGHAADYIVQKQVMQYAPAYIGVIGSRNKVKTLSAKLAADGFSAEEITRVHAPIGLAIKAETPEEIAISIAAELIKVRAEGNNKTD